ncbi:hypothetical protein F6X40_32400 [Paraburkholderia sp. UCT31]|uniref:hypothetical protein n=1 Tax=Paraburkholderia sp. UCT31 TaxID=2615209 RepID=UPI0016553F11|nr:hypothetical protein [Paraburkholderia sp. UCT31]MBC8741292.1 hypothetical protein [Paraburkholderia sp. UCT31]
MAAASASPEPHVRAAILKRDEIAKGATSDIATWRKGPSRLQGAAGTFVHSKQNGVRRRVLKHTCAFGSEQVNTSISL